MNVRSLLAIGKIVKAFGVHGELVILPMTDNLNRFKKLKSVYIGPSQDHVVESRIQGVSVSPRGVRLKLAAAEDRTTAERFIGSLLFVDEQHAIRLPKGTFFVHDIVGLKVFDQDKNLLGNVTDVLKYPANDVYVVDSNGKEILIPAVKEFIKRIDLESQTMSVYLIDGMMD